MYFTPSRLPGKKVAASILKNKKDNLENEENCFELVQKAGRHMQLKILTKEAEKREKKETILTHANMLKV